MAQNNSCKKMTVAASPQLPDSEGKQFATVFEHGTLEVEIYAPRGNDLQSPHRRDELYFVVAGAGEFVCGDTRQSFGPTDLLFAAAGVSHRFENFSDDLTLWVIFYGPDGGEAKLSLNKMPRT
jgi:mannose-6-phosphate isomerase-like protein (cupin superfamily)